MLPARRHAETEYLVLASQGGDAEAYRRLVELWKQPLWRHAWRLCGNEDGAWDILQEAWLAVADGIKGLRDPRRFRAWAYTIVSRRAADWLRQNPPVAPMELDALASADVPEPTGAVDLVRAGLARLAPDRRRLLALRYIDELELREISEVLGIPEGTVKSRLHHAREQLRDIIERLEQ